MKSLVVILTLCLVSPALARTWEITVAGLGDAPTIQAGIDSATDGDTVLVGPGTYQEFLHFSGREIVLTSTDGPANTVIDGSSRQGDFVVTISEGNLRSTVLQGFTLASTYIGIWIQDAEPSIIGNVVEKNLEGGIVAFGDASSGRTPLIAGNQIRENGGPGVKVTGNISALIQDNTIEDNSSNWGAGIFIGGSAPVVISGNRIVGNLALYDGAGILAVGSGHVIASNLVARNWTSVNGGDGIQLEGDHGWLHHNTIVDNGRSAESATGRGLVLNGALDTIVEQNIFAYNHDGSGIECINSETATLRNNLIWSNYPVDLGSGCEPLWDGHGNITADPYFCNSAGGDYRLAENSPARLHPAGPLGAFPGPGCGTVPVRSITWGRLKSRYR